VPVGLIQISGLRGADTLPEAPKVPRRSR
jgi:hypothetical protein